MRIFVASLVHETNSFSPFDTTFADYEGRGLYRPRRGDSYAPIASHVGYVDLLRAAETAGHEVVRGLSARAMPGGPTRRGDYESLRDELLAGLEQAMPLDAVLLMLHGSQIAYGYDDCEGDLIGHVRRKVGEGVPIGVELDLHCAVTDRMIRGATLVAACKEYPHTDFDEVATRICDVICRTATGEITPTMAHVRVPMLSLFHTPTPPFRGFLSRARELESLDGVLSVTIGHGFPWADVPDLGAHVIVATDDDQELARNLAQELSAEFFGLRDCDLRRYQTVDEVIDEAASAPRGPIVIADASDNPGGGTAGDSTFLLRRMLERGVEDAAVGVIWDPEMVSAATAAGVGTMLAVRIGGRHGRYSGAPIERRATVIGLNEDLRQRRPGDYPPVSMGAAAALDVQGIRVVVASLREQTFSPECFSALGIDPTSPKIVAVKSAQHFHARFSPIAARVLYCDAPGARTVDFARLPYRNLARPIWPLDEMQEWTP